MTSTCWDVRRCAMEWSLSTEPPMNGAQNPVCVSPFEELVHNDIVTHNLGLIFESLQYLPYALWIGNGVTLQLAQCGNGDSSDLLFSQILHRIEEGAGIKTKQGIEAPERLQKCKQSLGSASFQRQLRKELYERLRKHLEHATRSFPQDGKGVPAAFRSIATLGQLANPIVNFNIEHFTSFAIALSGGPIACRCFRRCDEQLAPNERTYFPESAGANQPRPMQYQRVIYHPHGLLDSSGLCVMSKDEYEAMDGTLALGLAVHLAFDSHLVIVGMSLDDSYLREQLMRYSDHYAKITWFSRPDDWSVSIQEWVRTMQQRNKIEIGKVEAENWSDFWKAVDKHLPAPSEDALATAWRELAKRVKQPGSRAAQLAAANPLLAEKFDPMLRATGESD